MPILIDIPYSPTIIEVDMAAQVRCVSLAPGEIETYTFAWQKVLGTDRIVTSEWELTPVYDPAPVTIDASSVLAGSVSTSVTISVSSTYEGCAELTLTNTIETVAGRTLKRCMEIKVEECGGCGC